VPTLTIEYRDEAERLGLEQAIAFFTQMRQVAQTAAAGTVLAACEEVALQDGRAFLRRTLAGAIQSRVAQDEQKGGRHATAPAHVSAPVSTRGGTAAPS
jgi:hypothetical protein